MAKLGTCYLDMDGVLVDFVGACERLFGFDRWKVVIPGEFYIHKWLKCDRDWLWKEVQDAGHNMWAHAEPCPWMGELLLFLHRTFEQVVVVTHSQDWPGCYSGKWEWLKKHYPGSGQPVFIKEKWRLAAPGCVLVDDFDGNVGDWVAHGGHAALFAQPWNLFHAEAMHRLFDPVAHLANRIEKYAESEFVASGDGVYI